MYTEIQDRQSLTVGRGMMTHRANCVHNYGTTETTWEIKNITDVFGHKDTRWFKVKWRGCEKLEWEREHLLVRDGCTEAIRDFWAQTGLQPVKEFYKEPEGNHRCTICGQEYKRAQDLKTHRTRTGHHDDKQKKVTTTTKRDAILQKKEGAAEEAAESEIDRRRKGRSRCTCKKQLAFQVLGVNI